MTSATEPRQSAAGGVRQNVANLGLFVLKQTVATLANPRPENLGSLININRELAAGLLGRALSRTATNLNEKTAARPRSFYLRRPGGQRACSRLLQIIDQAGLEQHRRGLHRGLHAGLQRQNLRADLLVRNALDLLEKVAQASRWSADGDPWPR